jgi:hypothetical protein
MISRICARLLLAYGLWAASTVQAATRSEVIKGATCIPSNPAAAQAVNHMLYGRGTDANCHLTMSDDWPVNNLSYVLFSARVISGVLWARLCVHDGEATVTCSSPHIMSAAGYTQTTWVALPSVMHYVAGAYLNFQFAPGGITIIYELIPVWIK